MKTIEAEIDKKDLLRIKYKLKLFLTANLVDSNFKVTKKTVVRSDSTIAQSLYIRIKIRFGDNSTQNLVDSNFKVTQIAVSRNDLSRV